MGTLSAKLRQGTVPWPERQRQAAASQRSSLAGNFGSWLTSAFARPPSLIHSHTSLAWQERANKLKASRSSQQLYGNFIQTLCVLFPFCNCKHLVCLYPEHKPVCKHWTLPWHERLSPMKSTITQDCVASCGAQTVATTNTATSPDRFKNEESASPLWVLCKAGSWYFTSDCAYSFSRQQRNTSRQCDHTGLRNRRLTDCF